jgi:hypothetical protein
MRRRGRPADRRSATAGPRLSGSANVDLFIYGLAPSPGAIADDKGNVVVFKTIIGMY